VCYSKGCFQPQGKYSTSFAAQRYTLLRSRRASERKQEREREDTALLRSRRALQAQSAHFLRFWPPAQPQHPHHQSLKNNAEAPLRTQEKTLTLFALAPELFQRKYFVSVSIHKHFLAAFLHIYYTWWCVRIHQMAWLLDAFSRRRWKVERGTGILIAFCQTGRVEDAAAISYFDVRELIITMLLF
jgi:hypothetical protein